MILKYAWKCLLRLIDPFLNYCVSKKLHIMCKCQSTCARAHTYLKAFFTNNTFLHMSYPLIKNRKSIFYAMSKLSVWESNKHVYHVRGRIEMIDANRVHLDSLSAQCKKTTVNQITKKEKQEILSSNINYPMF